ncbi:MAG TPA: GNAT family N-acetyltransferase [Phycisphaerae bacterium]|nr:GNAT family N-acetyltransferase [Phycisphaerae bacterium]
MGNTNKLNVGIVGACGRGASFKTACDAMGDVRILAVCDVNAEKLPAAAERLGARERYLDYGEMLEKSELHAVIIGTPMPHHVPQAVAALRKDLHVLSEVPAGISIEECRELTLAALASKGVYMMAENYTYFQPNAMVREMVARGEFGTPYYAEGEYVHELKGLNEITKWRRKWQTGINGVTYGTHSLGPILQWMPGDRVARVCCAGSAHHYRDPRGDEYENEDSCVMLCKMAGGGLVKVRVDMLSDRPHCMNNYELQGTDGCYESARAPGQKNRVWLRSHCKDPNEWLDLADLADEFLPEYWKRAMDAAQKAGHGGGDYFEVLDFVDAATGNRPPVIGIHEAMDMTLPGLVSQQSILEGGRWIDVPDSRQWTAAPPYRQLQMVWPAERLASPPPVNPPAGYELRNYTDADAPACLQLMHRAGFTDWTQERLAGSIRSVLPGGFFVIVHAASGALVATARAEHAPSDQHPYGGQLGWVAGEPDHKGKGLGLTVCAAATARLIHAGYRDIYLSTDDFRLPAIKTYLKLGYEPLPFCEGMAERWGAVREKLSQGRQDENAP